MVYIGAENIISPLGETAEANFQNLIDGQSGVKLHQNIGLKEEDFYASIIAELEDFNLEQVATKSIQQALNDLDSSYFEIDRLCLILSTTKGELSKLKANPGEASLLTFKNKIEERFTEFDEVQLLSNACISGLLALVRAHDLIESRLFDTVLVCGLDKLSKFTLAGFQSFFALSDEPCKPFDKNRAGINLGEACSTIVLSGIHGIYKSGSFKCLGGSSRGDANHISGPSRTGEGLVRTVCRTLEQAGINKNEIDFISAHGTGTSYNDEMEAIAFDRLGMNDIPLNSLKGYFGHTFGAAGVVETAICLQSMRSDTLVASIGFEETGTSKALNVISENLQTSVDLILKTASGFGGSNASILIRK
ncbi:beta-ketoacyl synthase [Crocinitomix catalasitica]|nr:beta-ketoacyl synthase [Crocinitomix catalasitica]